MRKGVFRALGGKGSREIKGGGENRRYKIEYYP